MIKFSNAINKILRFTITLVLIFLIVSMFIQILARVLSSTTFPWLEELIRILFVTSMFMGFSVAVREQSHIKIDILTSLIQKLGPTADFLINCVGWLGELAFFSFFAVSGYRYAMTNAKATTSMLHLSMRTIYLVIPITSVISIIFIFSNIYEKIIHMKEENK